MTTRSRYFLIVSVLVLIVGVGTGLVAYYMGFQPGAFTRRELEELRYLPHNASVVAYANVQDVMTSGLRQRIRRTLPRQENGQRAFQNETGINIETDIDRIVACLEPIGTRPPESGMVIARGRFDEVKIEALMRKHGAKVESYQGTRLIVGDRLKARESAPVEGASGDDAQVVPAGTGRFALAFIEPGLIAAGGTTLVRQAIALHASNGDSVVKNDELMTLVRALDSGNAWAVGRFDALRSNGHLPEGVAAQLPVITWFSASGQVDDGLRGVMRAETRDEEAANDLRNTVRGFLALVRLQTGSRPEFRDMMQSLALGGTGKTVALSFDVPAQLFDLLGAAASKQLEKQ